MRCFLHGQQLLQYVLRARGFLFAAWSLLHDGVLVPGDDLVDTVHDCLGLAGKSEGLGASEGRVVPLLGFGGGVCALLDLFSNLLSLQGEQP